MVTSRSHKFGSLGLDWQVLLRANLPTQADEFYFTLD